MATKRPPRTKKKNRVESTSAPRGFELTTDSTVAVRKAEGGWPEATVFTNVLRARIRGYLRSKGGRVHLSVISEVFGEEYNCCMKQADSRGMEKWLATDDMLAVVRVPNIVRPQQFETAVWVRDGGGRDRPDVWKHYPRKEELEETDTDKILATLPKYYEAAVATVDDWWTKVQERTEVSTPCCDSPETLAAGQGRPCLEVALDRTYVTR